MCHIVDMVLMLEEEEDTVDDWYVQQRLYSRING